MSHCTGLVGWVPISGQSTNESKVISLRPECHEARIRLKNQNVSLSHNLVIPQTALRSYSPILFPPTKLPASLQPKHLSMTAARGCPK